MRGGARGAGRGERDKSDETRNGGREAGKGDGGDGEPACGAALVLRTRDQGSERACPARMHVCIWRGGRRPSGRPAGGTGTAAEAAAAPNSTRHAAAAARPAGRSGRGGRGKGWKEGRGVVEEEFMAGP